MNVFNRSIRARVVDVEGQQATLAIYVEGFWHRIVARTEVPLIPGNWIQGRLLIMPPDVIVFRLEQQPDDATEKPTTAPSVGLDLEV
jgi:hypothetical protein